MNILGITGLGIAPAACLVQDGKLIAMAEEERFNRLKGSFGLLPEKATKFCLEYTQLSLDEIDYIIFPWDAYKYRLYMPYFFLITYLKHAPKIKTDPLVPKLEELLKYTPGKIKNTIASMLRRIGLKGRIPPVEFTSHHLAHAASAFYCSGFDNAYILVIDGSGEDKCTTIFKGEGLQIKEKKCFKIPDSLGWFYQSVTEFLGFTPNKNEGKVMALAPYGTYNEKINTKFKNIIQYNEKGNYKYDASYSFLGKHNHGTVYSEKMIALFKDVRFPKEPIEQIHKDIAFAAQNILEKIVISITKEISHYPDYNQNLCIAGGIGLNCKMNGVVAAQKYVNQVFIPPISNDAGSALGAALYFSKIKGYDPRLKLEHAYWGPAFTDGELKQSLENCGAKFKEDPTIETTTARLLSQNKIVGWFQGRMEIGPRALGARSILANPTKACMKDKVNKVKRRELWRPFAPSILYESKDEYFISPSESPFMTSTFVVSKKIKKTIPAVVHIDDTTRPHFVKENINPRYWKLINEFKKITGVPIILNTSFNTRGEPIVCTPEDALKTFYATNMEYIAIGNFLVYK